MLTIEDVVRYLRRFAPPELAEKWDNVGLLVGDTQHPVSRVITCLTLTPDVADEALARGAELVVTHHPVLFRPVQKLTAEDVQGQMLLRLIAGGVAVYSPHTGYDSAAAGINQQLAEGLGLHDIRPLRPAPATTMSKIVVFVPQDALDAVQRALWDAGAGQLGDYSECSFSLEGTGSFRGNEHSNPTIGQPGMHERVREVRLEVDCPRAQLDLAIRKLREAHPYEEPAFDIYPLENKTPSLLGSGRWGKVAASPEGKSLGAFLDDVKRLLHVDQLQFVGDRNQPVKSVAICCGAGGEFVTDALRQQCDVLLTGEARFHDALAARSQRLALVLPGHYATERPAMEHLARLLQTEFPPLAVLASQTETDPLQWG